jgi:tetratricopeptide (TPR) repeat protein
MERDEDGERDSSEDGEPGPRDDDYDLRDDDEFDLPDARDLSGKRCAFHDAEAAVLECARCGRAICDRCIRFLERSRICPKCARSRGGFRFVKRVLVAAVLLGGVGAAVFYFTRSLKSYEGFEDDTFDYGQYTQVVEKQRAHLDKEPCDQRVIVKHAQTLLDVGNYKGLITRTDRFFADCGPHPLLRRTTYAAHKKLGDLERAIADAAILIKDAPDKPAFWWWRGDAYEHAGRLEEAAADYRKALTLDPGHKSIPPALAGVLERLGKPCEAVPVLEQHLVHHPEDPGKAEIEARISRLRTAGNCKAAEGEPAKPKSKVKIH